MRSASLQTQHLLSDLQLFWPDSRNYFSLVQREGSTCYMGSQKELHQNLHKQIISLILKWRETQPFSYGKNKSQPLRATTQRGRNASNLFCAYRMSRRELVQQKAQSTASDPADLSVILLAILFARSENFYGYHLKYSS